MARPLAVTGGVLFVTLWFLGLLPHAVLLPLTVCAGVLCALVLCVRALRRKGLLPYVCAVVLAGCVLFWFHYDFVFAPVAALGGRTVPVTAALADLPQQLDDGYRTVLRTDSVDGMPMRCRIALYTSEEPKITCRQTVTFRTRLEANSAPGSSGVWLRAYEMRDARYTDDASGFFGRMLAVRQYAIETLLQRLPGTNGAVLAAMITGSEQYIPDDVYARMLECGIVHIFSVSGLHLSVFSMLLYRFLERRRAPRAVIALPSAVLTFLLMAVTGFSYSCVRAGIMLYIMLLGRCFFWRSDGLNALGASILVMVLIDPFCAGSVGLQLSVLGTLGVILASPIVETRVETLRVRPRFLRKPIRLFLSALLVSACIHILTLPVIVIEFRRLSLVSPLANACLLFAAEWAMITAAAAVLLSAVPFLGVLSKPLLFGAGLLAKYCVLVSDSFGKLPFAAVRSDFAGLRFWIVGTLIVVSAVLMLQGTLRRRVVVSAAVSVGILASLVGFHAWNLHDLAQITVLDAGNQSAVLVKSRGKTALIGCGGKDAPSRVSLYTDSVDLFVVPREQKTECGAAHILVRSVPCAEIWAPQRVPALEPLYFFADPVVTTRGTRTVGDIRLTFDSSAEAVFLEIYDRTALLLFSPGCDLGKIPRAWLDADFLVSRSDIPPALTAEHYAAVLLSRGSGQGDDPAREIVSRGGMAAATAGYGDICLQVRKDGAIGLERGDPYA